MDESFLEAKASYAVFAVDVRKFSLKDTSKSDISSLRRWSAVDAPLYDTTLFKLILREKSIHSAKNIVPCCCLMQRQTTKKLFYYEEAQNWPATKLFYYNIHIQICHTLITVLVT